MSKRSTRPWHAAAPRWLAAAVMATCPAGFAAAAGLPMPDHVVVVIEENKPYSSIIGNTVDAAYINSLALRGAVMSNSYGTDGSSQPNYLQLFSGANQGVVDNTTPQSFSTPNLRSALAARGLSFSGYSESLPFAGYTGSSATTLPGQNQYVRKHNPWVNWQGAASNAVPAAETLPFSSFPADFSSLPTVSFVVPNEQNNMHDGSIAAGDNWLLQNIDAYVTWAQTHNSLLILTWDEDDGQHGNHIMTLLVGPMVLPGFYPQAINHLNVLRTIEEMYGLAYVGNSAGVSAISGALVTSAVAEPSALSLWTGGGLCLWALGRRRAQRHDRLASS